jgi:RHS repeat-associated protein
LQYDAAGYVQRIESRAAEQIRRVDYRHDAVGRLIGRLGQHSGSRYEYNLLDQPLSISRQPSAAGGLLQIAADTVSFEYDRGGRLIAEHGSAGSIGYRRDALGNPLCITLPQQQRLEIVYGGAGEVKDMMFDGQVIARFERDDLHRESWRTQGRLVSNTTYTALGQFGKQESMPLTYTDSGEPLAGDTLYWREAAYSNNGGLVSSNDHLRGRIHYDLDRSQRLLRCFSDSFDLERFVWDSACNLVDDQRTSGGQPIASLLDNRLREYQDRHYVYDAWGQLVQMRGHGREMRYEWDAEGQLIAVSGNGQSARYHYDALGRRILKQVDAGKIDFATGAPEITATRFLWQGQRLLQERSAERVSTYLYQPDQGPGGNIALLRIDQLLDGGDGAGAAQVYHYHSDHNGVARAVSDDDGELVWAGHYLAWGKVTAQIGLLEQIRQALRLPGQYCDEESGLHYDGCNYHEPDSGRTIAPHPAGLAAGLHLYRQAPAAAGWLRACQPMLRHTMLSAYCERTALGGIEQLPPRSLPGSV